jgi:hypothetical protein
MTSLLEQANMVERLFLEERAHLNVLRDLAAKGKRPPFEPKMKEAKLPALRDAAVTLRKLAEAEGQTEPPKPPEDARADTVTADELLADL